MPKQSKAEMKSEPKKPSPKLETVKKAAGKQDKIEIITKTETKASAAKPVVLKLPRTLKKAARACAKAQGLKLRVWIVELIKIQLSNASATAATKSLQRA